MKLGLTRESLLVYLATIQPTEVPKGEMYFIWNENTPFVCYLMAYQPFRVI